MHNEYAFLLRSMNMKFKPAILAAAVASFVAFSANAADFPEMEIALAHSAAASHAV